MISPDYFDYSAATPLEPRVLAAMVPYFGNKFYNPSAGYLAAQSVKKDLDAARQLIAKHFGCKSTELIFTAGGTEANNLAIRGILEQYPNGNIVTSAIEHDSVLKPSSRFKHERVKVNSQGYVDVVDLRKKIDDDTALVSVMYVNNEVGTIQPIKQTAKIIEEIRRDRKLSKNLTPLYFHTDASQAGNFLSLNVNNLGVDMMTVNGGKIYGPKQSAVLYLKTGIKFYPIILGGGQERGFRSGTENVANYVGLSVAIDLAQTEYKQSAKRMEEIRKIALKLITENIPKSKINGGHSKIPSMIHLIVPGIDNETVMMKLDEFGFQVAVGSACKASNDEPSHVLMAMGFSRQEAQSTLRISMGKYTTRESVIHMINCLQKACQV
ncbi:MAG: cysteine desulfurase family protein [Candidatus Saccharimonadales bacterium]